MKTVQLERFTRKVRHQQSEPCRNCDTHFNGKFCPECGQEADTGAPTAMGFIYEFLTRNVLEKGKLPRTIWHLLRYPGGLTVDFLEGRRARYIRPVRLYLVFSILYFLLLSFQAAVLVKHLSVNADVVDAADVVREKEVAKNAAEREKSSLELKKWLDSIHFANPKQDALFKKEAIKRIDHFNALSQHEQIDEVLRNVINQAPKAMFFLVPVFAMLLKLLFVSRGIPYGAHLLFSAHYHALAFLVLMVLLLPMPTWLTGAGVLYICLYLPVAMRTTYLCGWIGALARCFLLSVSYSLAIGLAMASTLLVVVIGG